MLNELSNNFIQEFYNYSLPNAKYSKYTEEQIRNNDLKMLLQISSNSYLKMQAQIKGQTLSYTCKTYGKNCYEIVVYREDNYYKIQQFETKIHSKGCELNNQGKKFLQIYCLMKLKKDLIQKFMQDNQLMEAKPSDILNLMSNGQTYFFMSSIGNVNEYRKKLRKRFDNIVNIDIKKIMEKNKRISNEKQEKKSEKRIKNQQGNEQKEQIYYQDSKQEIIKMKLKKKLKKINKNIQNKQNKIFIKSNKQNRIKYNKINRENQHCQSSYNSHPILQLYHSQQNLPEINFLYDLQGLNNIYWDDDKSSSQGRNNDNSSYQIKNLQQDIFRSLRNSILKKSLETCSLHESINVNILQ